MSIRTGKLTVFFEEPFWVGIFERVENGKLSVSKVTFGTEPKDYEIWEFVLKEYDRLQFSPRRSAPAFCSPAADLRKTAYRNTQMLP